MRLTCKNGAEHCRNKSRAKELKSPGKYIIIKDERVLIYVFRASLDTHSRDKST